MKTKAKTNNQSSDIGKDVWEKSPITGREMVLIEYDDTNGMSKMDLSSGYYTNDHPLNYKKHPNFDIEEYEEKIPESIKKLRFDDGESYWYPGTLQTSEDMIFPVGDTIEEIKWCYAPIKKLTEEELKIYSNDVNFESKIDMGSAEYFDTYLDAAKKVRGYSLGNI